MKLVSSLIILCVMSLSVRGNPLSSGLATPCSHRYELVMQELHSTGDISTEPHYIPRCHRDGVKWQVAQCTHLDQPSCFCVDPQSGAPREDTRTRSPTLKILACDPRPCQHLLHRYQSYVDQHPLVADAPFGYEPSCEMNGRFEAMQRNAFSFFCVNTKTGEKILDTDYHPGVGRPVTERICQAYSNLWQRYKIWLEDNQLEDINTDDTGNPSEGSCPEGFEFHTCSCKSTCIPGSNMTDNIAGCEYCTPVCKCPNGLYEHNATCVTNNYCSALEPEPFTLNMKETLWNTYMLLNGNDIVKSHWESNEDDIFITSNYERLAEEDDSEELGWTTAVHRISDTTQAQRTFPIISTHETTRPNETEDDMSPENSTSSGTSSQLWNRLRLSGFTHIGNFLQIPSISQLIASSRPVSDNNHNNTNTTL